MCKKSIHRRCEKRLEVSEGAGRFRGLFGAFREVTELQRVRRGFGGISEVFHEASEDFQRVSETLQRSYIGVFRIFGGFHSRVCGFWRVFGRLQGLRLNFREFWTAFSRFRLETPFKANLKHLGTTGTPKNLVSETKLKRPVTKSPAETS